MQKPLIFFVFYVIIFKQFESLLSVVWIIYAGVAQDAIDEKIVAIAIPSQ